MKTEGGYHAVSVDQEIVLDQDRAENKGTKNAPLGEKKRATIGNKKGQ